MNRLRILVVDDEEPVLRACARALSEIPGAEIVQEKLSRSAAELLATESFDLLISDVRMPELDGVKLLKIARRCDPDLPVILTTAYPTLETTLEIKELGVLAYLVKPFTPDDLRAAVWRVLEGGETMGRLCRRGRRRQETG